MIARPGAKVIGPRARYASARFEGVRCVVTGPTPRPEPVWHENVLAIDTGVHIGDHSYGHLTIARIDAKEIEIWRFVRRKSGDPAQHDPDDG